MPWRASPTSCPPRSSVRQPHLQGRGGAGRNNGGSCVKKNRRFFLNSVAAAAAGVAVPAMLQEAQALEAQAEENAPRARGRLNVDVAVVGAGFSGLAACDRLATHG